MSSVLAFDNSRLIFAGYHGDYLEADLSNPENPRWIKDTRLTGDTEFLAHNGSLVLAAEGAAYALRLVDLGDGSAPLTRETVLLTGDVDGVAWRGHVAYALVDGEVQAIDFSTRNGAALTRTERISGWSASQGIAVEGKSMVIGSSARAGLAFFSLETPERPRLRTRMTAGVNESYGAVAAARGHAYAVFNGFNDQFLRIFDLRDPANPVLIEAIPTPDGVAAAGELRLEIEGGRMWIFTRNSSSGSMQHAYLFDLGNPALPSYRGRVSLGGTVGRAAGAGEFIVRTWMEGTSSSQKDPWGASPRRLRLDRTDLSGAEPQLNGPLSTAFFRHSAGPGPGRAIDLGLPHVVGDLILAPTGLHGFDVLRSEHLPRTAPRLVQPPESRTVALGTRAALSATVDGALPLAFQWLKDSAPVEDGPRIRGSRTFALVFDPAEPSDAGSYLLTVRNDAGAAASLPVRLELISAQPLRMRFSPGTATTWRIELSGTPGHAVRLQSSDNLITWQDEHAGAGVSEIELTNGTASIELARRNDGQRYYRAIVINNRHRGQR